MRIPFFSKPPTAAHYDEEVAAYNRLRERNYRPSAIIDVGAYEGNWTLAAWSVFGPVPTLLVEPQKAKSAVLEHIAGNSAGCRYEQAVLSDTVGRSVTFYEMETGSSLLPERSDARREELTLVTTTLDELFFDYSNVFLKIDAQGAELQILRGAAETLNRATLVQIEAAVANYNEGAPAMSEVLDFMQSRGFSLLDISGLTRIQSHLVHVDLLFVPADSAQRPSSFRFPA